jgi:Inner membrane component of T3SS, cytoplasmic domain
MDKIYFLSGPLQGATAELLGEEITIGRATDNALCLDDESVSDHHALLNLKGGEWIVKDLRSAGGTFVRGDRVLVSPLQDGDKLVFGSVEMEFQAAAAKLQLPSTAKMPDQPQVVTWPQYKGPAARARASGFKTAVQTLVQLAVLAAVVVGAYFTYQKFGHMEQAGEASPSDNAKAALPAVSSSAAPTAAYSQPKGEAALPAAPAAPAPSPVVATAPLQAAPVTNNPMIQQARLLLAQNKYADAVNYLDGVIASAKDPAVAAEAQAPLKQALEAQMSALLSAKQQWEAQCKTIQDRLKAAQDKLDQDTRALNQKKADEGRVYATSSGYWFNGRWIYNSRKGTGDDSQAAVQGSQITVMTDSQEVKKQTDLLGRYQSQVMALEQQIAPIQARVTQMNAALNAVPSTK